MLFTTEGESEDTSSSISPQSQLFQLDVPLEYGQVSIAEKSSGPDRQQALEGYVHGIPGDFSL